MTNLALLAEGAATSALDASTKAVIQGGLDTMQATITDVIGIVVVTAVAVIALTSGVNYALRKIRGIMSKAS